jgi:integrase
MAEVTEMIKRLKIKQASALWHIDGAEISMCHRTNISTEVTVTNIEAYKKNLQSGAYEQDNTTLCDAFRFFGGISFVAIGYNAYREEFLRMFRYYTKRFVKEWYESSKRLHSKEIGIGFVFETMLHHEKIPIKYRFMYILDEIDDSHQFVNMVNEEFSSFWMEKIQKAMVQNDNLQIISARIGMVRTIRYCMTMPENTVEYLEQMAKSYTNRREIITEHKFQRELLGEKINYPVFGAVFTKMFKSTVENEAAVQKQKFVAENQLQLDVYCDTWVLYKKHGPSLYYKKLDFTLISNTSLRLEVKHYMKHRFMGVYRIDDGIIYQIAEALNRMTERNPAIRYFADIDDVDVKALHIALENKKENYWGKEKSQLSTMKSISLCKQVYAYLMSNSRDENMKSPRPHHNPFEKLVFANSKEYVKNTPIIPEAVMNQLESYIGELDEVYQLLFKIFSNTGMRAKEVLFLEDDCLEKARYDGCVTLKYKPHKVLIARRKTGAGDYHRILIPSFLADDIRKRIADTELLREEYGLPYLFIRKRKNFKANMLNIWYFSQLINKLIEKHSICDEAGELWNFTSRQYRKTLAVTLIENGATIEELAYWLGHLNRETAAKFYAEVRKMKLAEMNTKFFKDKFDLLLSKDQLIDYSEEERRLLYMDFCLEQRKVEFGYCLKKAADGGCNNRNSLYNCINCKHLCTGRKYLPYWLELMEQQEAMVNHLLRVYAENGMTDYEGFKEYRQERFLLECYQNMVSSIKKSEVE